MSHFTCLRGAVCGALCLTALAARGQDAPPPAAPLPGVAIDYQAFSGTPADADALQVHLLYGGELSVRSDRVTGDLVHLDYNATGHVRVHEADTDLMSDSLHFQGASGTATEALLTQPPYTIRGAQIDVSPASVVAHDASASTAMPGAHPDLEVRAQTLSLFPQRHHGELRNASLYLFRVRVLSVPRIGFTIGTGAQNANRQGGIPSLGVSGRYGTYLAFGGNLGLRGPSPVHYRLILSTRQQTQVRLNSQQTVYQQMAPPVPLPAIAPVQPDYLGALRALATLRRPPLPAGDPLLFHDYLPDRNPIMIFDGPPLARVTVNEELSTHQEELGRRRDNIYVSRLPEASINGQVPLFRIRNDTDGAFRDRLRRVRFVAFGQGAAGYFREERPGETVATVHNNRERGVVGLRTEPLLVLPNTVILPQVQATTNIYSGQRRAYRFVQASVAVSHYFSPESAVEVQYLQSGQTGDSPFDFDVLDTTRELDLRAQAGSRHLAVAGLVRYDLARGGVFDYKLAVAPALQGLTPVLTYNFRNRNVGLGVQVRGLTF